MRAPILATLLLLLSTFPQFVAAQTIHYCLDVNPNGTFALYATTGNDNAGISGYGVELTGSITSLIHSTPTSATAHINGINFGSAGFSDIRSTDNEKFVLASQDVLTPTTHPLYGFGQTAGSFADLGLSTIAPQFESWEARLLLATGTYEGNARSIGIKNGPNTGGNVFINDQGLAVRSAELIFNVSIVPEPSTLLLTTLGLLGVATQRHRN